MKFTKSIQVFTIAFLMITMLSCSNDKVSSDGNVALRAKVTIDNTSAKDALESKNQASVTISSFKINIREIEFEIDDDDNDNEDLYSELELEGPFELNLLNGSTSISITKVTIPNNVYDEIEFDLYKSTNNQSEMFEKSIQIKGEIDGTPFVFWHDMMDEFEVDYSNNTVDILVDGSVTNITIDFDLSIIFGATSTIDFSIATDNNNDGLIEISPNDNDGNRNLADFIKNLLKESADLQDD